MLCARSERKNMIRSWKPGEFSWKESVIMDLPLRERKS